MPLDFLPTATLLRLQQRASLLAELRRVFTDGGYWECETPILSQDIVVDTNLDPFATQDADGTTFYLQTSPEAGMKRLLVAGASAIFQVSRVMRKGERGRKHNPEFTMVEWYRVGDSHLDQMQFVERLVQAIYHRASEFNPVLAANAAHWQQPFEILSYDDAFARYAGQRVLALSGRELREFAESRGLSIPAGMSDDDRDGWLNLLLAELVEPHLGFERPQFVCDYPASQAALAKLRAGSNPPVAERFELYDRGIELCNGYHELTDPEELAARTTMERARREGTGVGDLPGATRMAAAMKAGLPPCCGVALGFDRLVMLALGCASIDEVIAFPRERA